MTNVSVNKLGVWSLSVAIAVVFYCLNCQVPFFSDDINWIDSVDLKSWQGFITSILDRQSYMWMHENGRAMNHMIWQLSVGFGETFYNLFVSGVLLLYILVLMFLYQKKENRFSLLTLGVILIATLYLSPDSTTNFFWAAGGCHYLWPALLNVGYLLLLIKAKQRAFRWSIVFLLGIFSFCVGWTHEIFALPISFSLACYLAKQVYIGEIKRIPIQIWILITLYWLGALLIVVSPGTLHRIHGNYGGEEMPVFASLMTKLVTSFKIFRYGRCFYLLLLVLGVIGFSRKSSLKQFIKDNSFLLLCLVSAIGIIVLLRVGGRAVWSIEVFSLMLILRWIDSIDFERKWSNVYERISFCIIVVVIGHQFLLISPFKDSWQTYRDVVAQTEKPSFNGTASMEDWHSDKWWIEPFVAHPYDMMVEDMWMRIPLKTNVCRVDQYEYLKDKTSFFESGIAKNIGGDFYIPYSEDVERKILTGDFVMKLAPISYNSSESWLYLTWHQLLQKLWPQRYPESISSVYPTEISRIQVEDHVFIRFEKPVRPVYRQIMSVEIN